jgi:predicted lipid-binding transport protein (Tim44 family)
MLARSQIDLDRVERDAFVSEDIEPSSIADELWHLSRQHRSAWSFLTELRPFGEKW